MVLIERWMCDGCGETFSTKIAPKTAICNQKHRHHYCKECWPVFAPNQKKMKV